MSTPAVSVAIFETDKICFVKHKPGSRHPLDYYSLPGGAVEYGETRKAAAVREAREETGLEIDASDLEEVGRYAFTIERKIGEEEADMTLYKTKKFKGQLKESAETIPFWARIEDVLAGKYRMPKISGNFVPDVMKLLEKENARKSKK